MEAGDFINHRIQIENELCPTHFVKCFRLHYACNFSITHKIFLTVCEGNVCKKIISSEVKSFVVFIILENI